MPLDRLGEDVARIDYTSLREQRTSWLIGKGRSAAQSTASTSSAASAPSDR